MLYSALVAIIVSKTKISLDETWDLWIITSGPRSEVVISLTEGVQRPVRERITIHLSNAKAIRIARALAQLTYVGPDIVEDEDDMEDTKPG